MGAPEQYPDLYGEHLTGDPAYDKAFAALADCPSFAQVERALKAYAHELAEEIRVFAWGKSQGYDDATAAGARAAADRIDPEVPDSV